jgi:GH25 family lysozyme M1 (1,4-beta-N-acetylmuramidase)
MTFIVPDNARVWGIDISGRWDGNVDFSATKRAGATFVIIKCIDGTVPTRLWRENRIRAFTAGLFVGEYAWLYRDANVPCKDQARATWELIKNEPKQIPVCIDFEWTRFMGTPANPNYSDLDKWATEFTRLSGYKPGFYSAAGYMNDLGAMPLSLRSKFSHIWIANYDVPKPTMPKGFTPDAWQFWQFAATGEAAVIAPNDTGKQETDLNYWNGDLATFQKYFGLGETNPEPSPEPGEIMKGKVIKLTNIRAQNTQFSTDMGDLLAGDLVEWIEETTGADGLVWIKLIAATHNGAPVKCSDGADVRGRYCWANNVEEINPPAPEPVYPAFIVAHYADGTQKRYVAE